MPQRVNGSVFTDQTLTGSLRHFLLIGADFSQSFSDSEPVFGSAAEEIVRVITSKATIGIFNPTDIGISFALETNRANWGEQDLQDEIRALGTSVGQEELDLTNVRISEVEYNFLGSDLVFVVPDPTISALSTNNTYYASSSTTLTLPDYSDPQIDVGSIIRIFKFEDSTVTLEAQPGQEIRDLTLAVSAQTYIYSYNEEIRVVFDGSRWSVYRTDANSIAQVLGLQASLNSKQNQSEKGQPDGYASLGNAGLVPANQLPSYVDDVLEFPTLLEFPTSGALGKIYVSVASGRVYRWSGTTYVEISSRPLDTDEIPEGLTNLYYTDQRVDDRVSEFGFRNVLFIDQHPVSQNEFATINNAIDEIILRGDATDTNPYVIQVGAGYFQETPIVIPAFTTIAGYSQSTVIEAIDKTQHFITMQANTYVDKLTLIGPTDVGAYTVDINTDTSGEFRLFNVQFDTAYGLLNAVNNTTNAVSGLLTNLTVKSTADIINPFNIQTTNTGTFEIIFNGHIHLTANPAASVETYFNISGPATLVVLNEVLLNATVTPVDTALRIENGSTVLLANVSVTAANTTLHMPNIGTGSFVRSSGMISLAITNNLLIEHPGTTGSISGTFANNKISVVDGSPLIISLISPTGINVGQILVGEIFQGDKKERTINLSQLARASSTIGVTNGGALSPGPGVSQVTIAPGNGYVEATSDSYLTEVSWDTTVIDVPENQSVWIVVRSGGIPQALLSPPSNFINFILLGRAFAKNGQLQFIEDIANNNTHAYNRATQFFREALGPVFSTGSIVSENTTALKLNVSPGRYYYGNNLYQPTGGSAVNFFQTVRNDSGDSDFEISDIVPVQYVNDSGVLVNLTNNYYTKHSLYLVGEGTNERFTLVIGQEEYDNISVAEQADLPLPPSPVTESFALVASIIVKQGNSNIVRILDERPVIGFKSAGVSASTTHGNLLGLTSDDHLQYLRTDGARLLTGNLNLDNNLIINSGLINGVNITSHASRHLPNGADPLATGTPSTVGTDNATGIANALARRDHVHSHGNQLGGLLHAVATPSIAGFMSSSDKTRFDNINTDDVPEGTLNLYFTESQVRDSISAGTGVLYNSATGVVSIGQSVATTADVTFNNLTVTGFTDLGSVAAIAIYGGEVNYVLSTDGSGVLSWQPSGITLTYTNSLSTSQSVSTGTDYVGVSGLEQDVEAGDYRIEGAIEYEVVPEIVSSRCAADLIVLVDEINALAGTATTGGPAYGAGNTLTPGVYITTGAATYSGNLEFDAQGDPDAIFIVILRAALAHASNSTATLVNGANASNIFWLVDGALTFGGNCQVFGTFIGSGAISPSDVLEYTGRMLTRSGAINMTNATYAVPTGKTTLTIGALTTFAVFTPAGAISNTNVLGNVGDITSGLGANSGFNDIRGTIYTPTDTLAEVEFQIVHGTALVVASQRTISSRQFSRTESVSLEGIALAVQDNDNISIQVRVAIGSVVLGNRNIWAKALTSTLSTPTGTVTSIVAGNFLTGGTITTDGTIAVDATSANTPNKVVARNASGNFSAGTINGVSIQAHGSRHLPTGADPIPTSSAVNTSTNTNSTGTANSLVRSDHTHQLSSNTPSTSQVLQWNGTNWVGVDATSVAGSLYSAYNEQESQLDNATATYADALILNFTVPSNGTYKIEYGAEANNTNIDEESVTRLLLDGVTTLAELVHGRQNDNVTATENFHSVGSFRRINLTAGAHTLIIQHKANAGIGTSQVRRLVIEVNQIG